MKATATICEPTAITPASFALLYLRADQVIQVLPISRRTLSNWQARRVLPVYKVGRTVMFKRTDIEAALERFKIAAVGETTPKAVTSRKRRAGRITKGD